MLGLLLGILVSFGFGVHSLTAELTTVTTRPQARPTNLATSNSQSAASSDALPRCVDQKAQVDGILAEMKANSKNQYKYRGYRAELQSDSEEVLLARLAYAETLATNCPEKNREVAPLIVNTIINRVAKKNGDIAAVVFQRDQFASSLNSYSDSRFRDFLCPKDEALWKATLMNVREMLPRGNSARKLSSDTVHYYLYRHSTKFSPPAWAQGPSAYPEDGASRSSNLSSCVRFFRNSQWK